MGQLKQPHTDHEHPGYGLFFVVWIALVALTALTVGVAGVDMGYYTVYIALFIAVIKAMLVINYFMHIKFDHILIKIIVGGCGFIFAVVMLFLSFDVITF
jgi:cytochrome c oxidase subunit 4